MKLRLENISVLAVEDQLVARQILVRVLERHGAKVYEAENGQVALNHFQNHDIDLVLMDLQMPILDGYGATEQLRNNGSRTPVIALTAASDEECLMLHTKGFDDYFQKPIVVSDLVDKILKHI